MHRIVCGSPTSPTCRPGAGFLYLAIVLDVFSRRGGGVVDGYSSAHRAGAPRAEHGLGPAPPPSASCITPTRGSQYTSLAFGKRCQEMGVIPSTGSAGDCFDNAMAESFFATLECELIDRRSFHTPAEARRAVFEFIEGWYDRSSLRTSFYVIDGKRLSWLASGTARCVRWARAEAAMAWPRVPSRSVRRNSHGPSLNGCRASIFPRSAATRSVRGATPMSAAASRRLSQGS